MNKETARLILERDKIECEIQQHLTKLKKWDTDCTCSIPDAIMLTAEDARPNGYCMKCGGYIDTDKILYGGRK